MSFRPFSPFSPFRGAPVDQGLIGHWKLDDGTGILAADSSGNGNNGVLANGATWVSGHSGSAVGFDGVSAYVNIPSCPGVTSAYTLAFWAKPSGFIAFRPYIIRGNGNADDIEFYQQSITNYILLHNRDNGGAMAYLSLPIIPVGIWTHIALTYDAARPEGGYTRWHVYYAGIIQTPSGGSGSGNPPLGSTSRWQIGQTEHSIFGAVKNYLGDLDDVRIYNRALGPMEVAQLASA